MTSLIFDKCTQWYNHSYSEGARQPCRPQISTYPLCTQSFHFTHFTLCRRQPLDLFFFSPLKFYLCSNITNGSIHNVIFWVWLFGTVHLRFIHYYMFCYFVPFLLVSSVLLNGFTSLFTIFPIEGHLDYWQFWVIMNETAKYICTQTCVWAQAFISFG